MTRVLIHVPKSSATSGASLRFTATLEDGQNIVAEGRIDKQSHYYGASIVGKGEWPIHRFVADKNGNPIQDPESVSMTKAEVTQHDAMLAKVEDADVSTVGDMADQLNNMQEAMASMKQQLDQKADEILAKDKQIQAELERAETLGKPNKASNKKDK